MIKYSNLIKKKEVIGKNDVNIFSSNSSQQPITRKNYLNLKTNTSYFKSNDICEIPYLKLDGHDSMETEKECKLKEDWGYLKNNIWYYIPRIKEALDSYYCNYRSLKRINDFKYEYSKFFSLTHGLLIQEEVFEVNCKDKRKRTLYDGLFVQLVKINKANNLAEAKENKPLNIILMSFDSVSRVSWLKRLKRTNKYIFDEMKFELLKGYNIVGDGTPAGKI